MGHTPTYNIAMIGCGKVGAPTAKYLTFLGHDVREYDPAFDTGDTLETAVIDRDIVLIAVPTPHAAPYGGTTPSTHLPPSDFDYSILEDVVAQIDAVNGTVPIVIISTVLPGTIRERFGKYGDRIVYSPFLISMGAVEQDLKVPDIVIIGTQDAEQTDGSMIMKELYNGMIETPEHHRRSLNRRMTWEEAECVKIFYNTYISTKLAIANTIQDVARKIGNCDADVVSDSLMECDLRITSGRYMTPGSLDGGPCHPRDNIAMSFLAEKYDLGYDLFSGISAAREGQAKNIAKFLADTAAEHSLPIFIHGKAFKPKTDLVDGSPSLLIGHYVKYYTGIDPIYIDPLTEPSVPKSVKGVILIAHCESITYDTNYCEQPTYCKFDKGSVVVDLWGNFTPFSETKGIKVIHYGDTRRSSE